jgi:deacetoxycephalosporin-C hydroxylase
MGLSNNLFPSPRFEAIWKDYFRRLYGVAQESARCLLMSIDSYSGQDMGRLLDCEPVLRLRYFPVAPEIGWPNESRCAWRPTTTYRS